MVTRCPFCDIQMYEIVNEDYPNLETYLCYECGFHADTFLMKERGLYQAYQKLYIHAIDVLKPKKLPSRKLSDESRQRDDNETTDDKYTEPKIIKNK
jgi:hypothetical protein